MSTSHSHGDQPATPPAHTHSHTEQTEDAHDHEDGDDVAGHTHPADHEHAIGQVCCRDTVLKINGQAFDLSVQPLTVQFAGFTLNLAYNCADERQPGETMIEKHKDFEFEIRGPNTGDLLKGLSPGRLFINGKHIEFIYNPRNGTIRHGSMFSIHRSVSDFARAFVSANPTLDESGHHH